jgi:hypothetical protein
VSPMAPLRRRLHRTRNLTDLQCFPGSRSAHRVSPRSGLKWRRKRDANPRSSAAGVDSVSKGVGAGTLKRELFQKPHSPWGDQRFEFLLLGQSVGQVTRCNRFRDARSGIIGKFHGREWDAAPSGLHGSREAQRRYAPNIVIRRAE